MVSIKLPDGAVRQFDAPVSVGDVAAAIGPGLAKAALAGKVDGKVVDTSYVIDRDAALAIVTEKDPEGLDVIRHSTAHLLAYAVKELFPDAQVTIGPVIEDGFYYDFSYKRPFTPEDLAAIEARMAELAKRDEPVVRSEMPRDDAVKMFERMGEHYKAEIIASIPSNEPISLYREGEFIDLCRGPHVPSTGKLKVFKLMKLAGAYWRGDSKNEMLQRIYGTAWAKKEDLEAYITRIEEAEKRDHRKLGRALDLFHLQDEAPGMVFWHPKGWSIWQQVEQYMRRVYQDNGYQEVQGAADPRPRAVGALRPLAELQGEHVHDRVGEARLRGEADELPGPHPDLQLATCAATATCRCATASSAPATATSRRARCTASCACARSRRTTATSSAPRSRSRASASRSTDLSLDVYRDFGFTDVAIKIALRPDQRLGDDATWDRAENALRNALRECGVEWTELPGEGAFYGPKIEYHLKDSIGRSWQCGTMQVDFQMPGRAGRRVRRRRRHPPGAGHAAPRDRRLARAVHRHADRALRRRAAAVARAAAGGGAQHHRSRGGLRARPSSARSRPPDSGRPPICVMRK